MSKVPKDMGEKVQKELQKALDEWRDLVFIDNVQGYLKNRKTQKIEKEE